jgi:adenosylhomocysteine nucleosidase
MQRWAALLTGFGRRVMSEVAYVAALKREVAPLIKNWRRTQTAYSGRNFEFFENGGTVLVCGGIGAEAARRATEAVIKLHQPKEVVSVGFVGALDPDLRVGAILEPATVVDARDGSRVQTEHGFGILVSFSSVAGSGQKEKLARSYNAQTVDMEAASVARGAQAHGLHFRALKAVSDELQFPMIPMDRFIDADGQFRTAGFALYASLRPTLWMTVVRMAHNSAIASRALCARLQNEIEASTQSFAAESIARKQ